MKITAIRLHLIRAKLRKAFWMSMEAYREASEIIVQIETDEGIVGIGEIHGRPLEKIAEIIQREYAPMLIGRNPLATESIYDQLFQTTCNRRVNTISYSSGQPHFGHSGRPQMMAAIAGIDIALWDIKGKSHGLPIFRLLGGQNNCVPTYASGGYYGPDGEASVDELVTEMSGYVEAGFTAVKMKVGGLPIGLDVARVRAVRDAVGSDVSIYLDANQGYDVVSAMAAARAFSALNIGWFEEPVQWYDPVFGLKRVALSTHIPIASGESEFHRWGCRDLIEHAGIHFMQFDCTRAGGVTEWLKVAAYAASNGVLMAPHHDCQIHGHLVAAVPNGSVLEVFPNPERDPLWDELFVEKPEIRNGFAYLSENAGFGFELNPAGLTKYGVEFSST